MNVTELGGKCTQIWLNGDAVCSLCVPTWHKFPGCLSTTLRYVVPCARINPSECTHGHGGDAIDVGCCKNLYSLILRHADVVSPYQLVSIRVGCCWCGHAIYDHVCCDHTLPNVFPRCPRVWRLTTVWGTFVMVISSHGCSSDSKNCVWCKWYSSH